MVAATEATGSPEMMQTARAPAFLGADALVHTSRMLPKPYFHNLYFHHSIADSGEKTEKAADRGVFQVMVAKHVPPAGYLQAWVPRADFARCSGDGKIGSDILDFGVLQPGFQHQFHGLLVGGVKYQHAAGKNVRHGLYQCLHLLIQKVAAAVSASVPVVEAPAMPIFWLPLAFSHEIAASMRSSG